MADFLASALVSAVVAFTWLAWIGLGRRARPSYERIERGGASPLFPREAQMAGFWALQPLVRLLARAGVSANLITLASLPLAAAAAVAFGEERYGIGALFAGVSFLADALDGAVARATATNGPSGAMLDTVVDRLGETLVLGGLALAWHDSLVLLVAVLAAGSGSQLVTLASARAEARGRSDVPRGMMRRGERALWIVASAVVAGVLQTRAPEYARLPLACALALIALIGHASALHRFHVLASPPARRDRSAGVSRAPSDAK